METQVLWGDCLDVLKGIKKESVDLVYIDPPFYSQRRHRLSNRDRVTEYAFDDRWESPTAYKDFIGERLLAFHGVLSRKGSIFFHCDRNASHIARILLDEVFGAGHFRAEIIWHYKRWSNAAKNLLPSHQAILYYSKSYEYKFNTILTGYSSTTNVDQILQRRSRDRSNKSVYARDRNGEVVYRGQKKGVPLSDVWEIPFLNPKARERTGYPTQKPVLLLQRIIQIASDPGDLVLDPFCGSGTTLVAAEMLGRHGIGIDISKEAIKLTRKRLQQPMMTESQLLNNGAEAYNNADAEALALLKGIPHVPVQRNKGIDAFLNATVDGIPVPVRIQRPGESISQAAMALYKAAISKRTPLMILVATNDPPLLFPEAPPPRPVVVVNSAGLSMQRLLSNLNVADIRKLSEAASEINKKNKIEKFVSI
jgi:site-specific DNA-methyltransferase (adenine-specific)